MVISTLMKLAGGSPSFASELNIDAFLEQVGLLENGQLQFNVTLIAICHMKLFG